MSKKSIKICDICKQEYPEHELEEIFTGRKRYICQECYRSGQNQIQSRVKAQMRKYKKGKED